MDGLGYRIDLQAHLVHVHFERSPTLDEVSRLIDDVLRDPAFHKDINWIIDRRDVPDAPTTEYARGLTSLLQRRRSQLGRCRCAIVAREGAGFGMARMQEALLAPLRIEVMVYTDWNSAVAWVGTGSA